MLNTISTPFVFFFSFLTLIFSLLQIRNYNKVHINITSHLSVHLSGVAVERCSVHFEN